MSKLKTNPQYTIYNILYTLPFFLAFLERTVFDFGPNYELLTAAIILSSYFLNRKSIFLLTFLVIAFSDRMLGNSKIFLFTWTGFLVPAFFVSPVLKSLYTKYNILYTNLSGSLQHKLKLLSLVIAGVSTNFFFFTWTNFGVWLLDSWGMYTKDLAGLTACYINALPFLKNQIISSLIFIPAGYLLIRIAYILVRSFQPHTSMSFPTCLRRQA